VFVVAAASGQKANRRVPALIEDRLPLPGRFLLSDPARLASLHEQAGLTARQIASRLDVSHSAVLAALGKLGIACEGPRNGHAVKGQVPFGWDLHDARLVKNGAEHQVIRLIRRLKGSGRAEPAARAYQERGAVAGEHRGEDPAEAGPRHGVTRCRGDRLLLVRYLMDSEPANVLPVGDEGCR
jgi:hypothetical protein